MRYFEFYWPDFNVAVPVRLQDDKFPDECEAFWKGLPYKTVFCASMSAGEMFKIPFSKPIPPTPPEKTVFYPEQPIGTMIYLSWVGSMLLKYGTVAEPFRGPVIGLVDKEHIPTLLQVSMKLRDAYFFTKEVNLAEIRRKA